MSGSIVNPAVKVLTTAKLDLIGSSINKKLIKTILRLIFMSMGTELAED